MKAVFVIGVAGGIASLAAALVPSEQVQAFGPFLALCTMVGMLSAWLVTAGDRQQSADGAAARERAA